MPVSKGTVTSVNWWGRTVALTDPAMGKGFPGVGARPWSTYFPGARATVNRPSSPELTVVTTSPEASFTWICAAIGLSGHGLSARSTGHNGPRVTSPLIPESPPADPVPPPGPDDCFAHPTRAARTTIASTEGRFIIVASDA